MYPKIAISLNFSTTWMAIHYSVNLGHFKIPKSHNGDVLFSQLIPTQIDFPQSTFNLKPINPQTYNYQKIAKNAAEIS